MYRTSGIRDFLTVFFSCGSKPLEIWEVTIKNGHIARLQDPEIKSMVLDIRGCNVSTTYMTCPSNNRVLGITMPFMVMVVKNLKKYFTFEVTILDDTGTRRRFRVSNFQSTTQIMPLSTVMPIALADGWNQIQFNLSEFTRRAYQKSFVEVQKLKINANIRLRRIYFAQKLTAEEDLPPEYRIFLPIPHKTVRRIAQGGKSLTKMQGSQEIVTSKSKQKISPVTSVVDLPHPSIHDVLETEVAETSKIDPTEVKEGPLEEQAAPKPDEVSPYAEDATHKDTEEARKSSVQSKELQGPMEDAEVTSKSSKPSQEDAEGARKSSRQSLELINEMPPEDQDTQNG